MHNYDRPDDFAAARGIAVALFLSVPAWCAVALIVIGLRRVAF